MPFKKDHSVTLWLFICCGMVFAMALLGAITRLTESGLSITDWNPVMGAIPPLSQAAWEKAFAAYRQIPQYQVLHRGMTLDEFKGIYFWEWLHRLWGRLIGIAFGAPLIVFWARKKITPALAMRLLAIFALGALQGFIGWFMVESGLLVRTSVSPYRLALHLGFALLIYSVMLWTGLDHTEDIGCHPREGGGPSPVPQSGRWMPACAGMTARIEVKGLLPHAWTALGFLAVTMTWGAFTAGLHAGEVYNTWPLMEGDILPAAAFTLLPKWINAFENVALVQFIHRWLAPATVLVILAWVWRALRVKEIKGKRLLYALGGMALLQATLGLATLLSHAEIAWAVLHQAGAITLLTLLLLNIHAIQGRSARPNARKD